MSTDLAGVQERGYFVGDARTCTALVRMGSEVCEWRRVASQSPDRLYLKRRVLIQRNER